MRLTLLLLSFDIAYLVSQKLVEKKVVFKLIENYQFKCPIISIRNIIRNMRQLLLALLITLALTQTVLIHSDPSTTAVSTPSDQTAVLDKYHNLNHPNYLGNQAKWIWTSNPLIAFLSATFVAHFYSDCPQAIAVLRITAESSFTVYLNSELIGSGNNWAQVYLIKVNLICGRNHLEVVVNNKDRNCRPGLIFAVVQDQSQCYSCKDNPSAFYNPDTCSCQCSAQCGCAHELQKWISYPFCGCKCNVNTFAACKAETQYWDERTCNCQCKKRECLYGFSQDPSSCDCVCIEKKCPLGQVWNQEKCNCQRTCQRVCPPPKFWNESTGRCECPLLFAPCPNGQNPVTCECYPVVRYELPKILPVCQTAFSAECSGSA